jgi:predicted amidophosphoribosyltransferase
VHISSVLGSRDWELQGDESRKAGFLLQQQPQSCNLISMERVCSQCHAVLAEITKADWCPACGGALVERSKSLESEHLRGNPVEVDHRGIVLPRRHALGGIITPQ